MNEQIRTYLEKYPDDIIEMFRKLRQAVYDSVPSVSEEKMWAKLPSYYVGEKFVRLIPFKDHINVEAQAIAKHREKLAGYKCTPKGMLQIYVNQAVPNDVLGLIFAETLGE